MKNIDLSSIIERVSDFIITVPGIITVSGIVVLLVTSLVVLIVKIRKGDKQEVVKSNVSNNEVSELDKNLEILEASIKNSSVDNKDNMNVASNQNMNNENNIVSESLDVVDNSFINDQEVLNDNIISNNTDNDMGKLNDMIIGDINPVANDNMNTLNDNGVVDLTASDINETVVPINESIQNTTLNDQLLKPIEIEETKPVVEESPIINNNVENIQDINNQETTVDYSTILQPINVQEVPKEIEKNSDNVVTDVPGVKENPEESIVDEDDDFKIDIARELSSTIEIPSIDFTSVDDEIKSDVVDDDKRSENSTVDEKEKTIIKSEVVDNTEELL